MVPPHWLSRCTHSAWRACCIPPHLAQKSRSSFDFPGSLQSPFFVAASNVAGHSATCRKSHPLAWPPWNDRR